MSKVTRPKDAPKSKPEPTFVETLEGFLVLGIIVIAVYYWLNSGDDTNTAMNNTSVKYSTPTRGQLLRECRDKIKLQLNYPAEAEFYLATGSTIRDDFISIRFNAKNAFGMVTEHYGVCNKNGSVVISSAR